LEEEYGIKIVTPACSESEKVSKILKKLGGQQVYASASTRILKDDSPMNYRSGLPLKSFRANLVGL